MGSLIVGPKTQEQAHNRIQNCIAERTNEGGAQDLPVALGQIPGSKPVAEDIGESIEQHQDECDNRNILSTITARGCPVPTESEDALADDLQIPMRNPPKRNRLAGAGIQREHAGRSRDIVTRRNKRPRSTQATLRE